MMQVHPDLVFECQLWKSGLKTIAGLDEAGRGALAGPVAVGAVILPNDPILLLGTRRSRGRSMTLPDLRGVLSAVRDSKQMTALQRERTAPHIKQFALAWGVGFASSDEIDSDGIVQATRLAALRALQELPVFPEYLLTDFRLELPQLDISQTALVKGDIRCLSIAAASILAKTARDALMCEMDLQIPGYGLAKHKGYGTLAHRRAVRSLGYSPYHRKSFSIKQ
jgi:ribonuclease HII